MEIAGAAGDVTTARSAASELTEIATTFGAVALAAAAASAAARIEFGEGDLAAALHTLPRAQRLWQEAGVPYEAARARLVLADVHLALGNVESAALELRAAHQTFERLGAIPDDRRAVAAPAFDRGRRGRRYGLRPGGGRTDVHAAAVRRGSGYQGKGVHTAARVGAQAQRDEIIASAETLARVETGLPISERRTVKLKGIAAPVEVAAIHWT